MTTTHTPAETAVPTGRLRRLWEGWKRIAHRIGNVQARVMLTVFYIVIVTPFALAVRALSDPMRFAAPPAWLPKDPIGNDTGAYAKRQY
jgi:hypothetical protein